MSKERIDIINRKAKHDYHFDKMLVAGIVLAGSEVKSIRDSRISFVDSYCIFNNSELIIKNLHISVLENTKPHDPIADRKLLLRKQELKKLQKELISGYSIVPYKIFENERGILKIEIALAKGKKNHDKKESIKERDIKRQTQKELKR